MIYRAFGVLYVTNNNNNHHVYGWLASWLAGWLNVSLDSTTEIFFRDRVSSVNIFNEWQSKNNYVKYYFQLNMLPTFFLFYCVWLHIYYIYMYIYICGPFAIFRTRLKCKWWHWKSWFSLKIRILFQVFLIDSNT